jgi:hypothetical protein
LGIKHQIGRAVFALGARVSDRTVTSLDNLLNYMAVGRWTRSRGLHAVPSFRDKYRLWERIARDVAQRRTLYLEFGVYEGASMRVWSKLLTNPSSQLHGFDSFEGLPEDWSLLDRRGLFSTGGTVPVLDDPRVKFFKGWFQDVLPTYSPPEHDQLVVSLDADLYSSTLYVLRWLKPHIVPGTCLYFDEFRHRHHEMKAFTEFEQESAMQFEAIGESFCWQHVAFRRTG